MIKNAELLSDKFKMLAEKIYCYFKELNMVDVQAFAQRIDFEYPYVEYIGSRVRFVFYYSPKEIEREEQIHITNIILDEEERHKGYFSGLMEILRNWREDNDGSSILFEQVVSNNLKEMLINRYNGQIACDDERGCFIFVW